MRRQFDGEVPTVLKSIFSRLISFDQKLSNSRSNNDNKDLLCFCNLQNVVAFDEQVIEEHTIRIEI